MTGEETANLIEEESIRATAKRGDLHEQHVHGLLHGPLGGTHDTVGERPLGEDMCLSHWHIEVTGYVLGDDIGTQRCRDIGEAVLYERVAVVGTTGKQDDGTAATDGILVDAAVHRHHFVLVGVERHQCLHEGSLDALLLDAQSHEVGAALAVERLFVLEGERGRVDGRICSLHALDDLRVARHHRAVVAVLFATRALVHHKGHEYAVNTAVDELLHMGVGQLGWEADVVGHDLMHCLLVASVVGLRREHHLEAALRK